MTLTTILSLLPLVTGSLDGPYSGRFEGHPNLRPLVEVLDATLEEAKDLIPSWLAKELPEISYRMVDLAEVGKSHGWPAALALGKTDFGGGAYAVEIPIDSLIVDPRRGRGAAIRDIVYCLGLDTAMRSGGGFAMMADLGNMNPVIQATSSFLAGELQAEIEYLLSKHLDTDEALEACFTEIDPDTGASGSAWTFPYRPDDDVTFLILVDYLTPNGKDKKLGTLYTAITRGQPVEGALKKATRKKLKKLNPELRKAFSAYLEERFPSTQRQLYREIVAGIETRDWQAALEKAEAFLQQHEDSMATPNASWLRARALVALEPELAEQALGDFIEEHGSRSPFAWEAQLQLGLLAKQAGDHSAARASLELLARDHGWIPGVRARAERELAALGD